jgi:hypothetical protein
MRKFLLATAILLASATAYAAEPAPITGNDAPKAQPVETAPEPAKALEPAKAPDPAKAAEPTMAARPAPVVETAPVQVSKPKQHAKRHERDEQKARRIAAKYGVSW